MSAALKHLAALPAYVVSLDRTPERFDGWHADNGDLFGEVWRVHAWDMDDITDIEAHAWTAEEHRSIARTRTLVGDRHNLNMLVNESRMRYDLRKQKFAMACARSHVSALTLALADGHDRFVVAEDDAVPRASLRREDVAAPPGDVDIAVWGGAIELCSFKNDDALFTSGRSHRWEAIPNPHNALAATTYEVSHAGAEAILSACIEYPMIYDHSWAHAFARVASVRMRPNIFAQRGESLRNGRVRRPTLTRDKENT